MTATPQSQWQSIRPWSHRLSLSIREITSVSVTFILASTLTGANGGPEISLSSLGLVADGDEAEDDDDDDDFMENKKHAIISDALAKGFSINVNGIPWQRVLIRIDDKTDEAVIIIFGLMPGRQYDVDLGLVQGGQNSSIRKHVITEDPSKVISTPHQDNNNREIDIAVPESMPPTTMPSTSPVRTMPTVPQSNSSHSDASSTPLTVEERLRQLQADLVLTNTDRDNLTASLKSSRRDAQKADAALRSEIDVLKRASEKHTAAEHRARQKVLALQEAVKRAQAATKEVEGLVQDIETALPALRETRDEKESEYTKVKEETERAQREWAKEAEKNKKRVEVVTGELTALYNKLEKLNSKKEKLENSVISDLEEQLREIGQEIQKVESESSGHGITSEGEEISGFDSEANAFSDEMMDQLSRTGVLHSPPYHLPVQRQRHQSQHSLGAIARPSIAPIQRPSLMNPQPWAPNRPPHNPRLVLPPQSHSPTFPGHRPLLSVKSSTQPGIIQLPHHSAPGVTSPSPAAAVPVSTLSSRALAFEPNATVALRSTHPSSAVETNAGSSYSVPIHRPRQSISNPSRPVRGPGNPM